MGSDVRHVRGEAQKELAKKFEVFSSNGRSRWQVWSDWITITNIAQCTSVYVSPEHEIKAVPTGGGNVYRLGQYETAEIARAVLNDLYMHIPTGCIYQMPNDQRARVLVRGMSDERPEKFAGNGKKPVRRGGS